MMNDQDVTLRVIDIIGGTSVDGPGLRTSVYLAGCLHHCPQCHNPQSWNPDGGIAMTIEEIVERIDCEGFNVTITGGDPFMQPEALVHLLRWLKAKGLNVWCYTGYTLEYLQANERFAPLLNYIDTIVDGPFVAALRDTSLPFRGSSNQRIIDLATGSKR